MYDSIFKDAYNKYFGVNSDMDNITQANTTKPRINKLSASGNISDIDALGEVLRKILNAAWGKDWGIFAPEFSANDNPENIKLPQIVYEIISREVSEKKPIKPMLTDIVEEEIDGVKTGDSFYVYRQWFDCIVEFNFIGRNKQEARKIMNDFETLMLTYSGYLKKNGISEIIFLKEEQSKASTMSNLLELGLGLKTLIYFIKLEKISTIRTSVINRINIELNGENLAEIDIDTNNNYADIFSKSSLTIETTNE